MARTKQTARKSEPGASPGQGASAQSSRAAALRTSLSIVAERFKAQSRAKEDGLSLGRVSVQGDSPASPNLRSGHLLFDYSGFTPTEGDQRHRLPRPWEDPRREVKASRAMPLWPNAIFSAAGSFSDASNDSTVGTVRYRRMAPTESSAAPGLVWNNTAFQFAKEAHSGTDRLDYERYATALAGLFSTSEIDVLPSAVGIYAPWGAGKSFLLDLLKSQLRGPPAQQTRLDFCLHAACCCCLPSVLRIISQSLFGVVVRAAFEALVAWFRTCRQGCVRSAIVDEESAGGTGSLSGDGGGRRAFILVEFNAWECAGSEVLWAALITKIFDKVEGHPAFGRGIVRAARITKVLESSSWDWCGFLTLYAAIAILGAIVVAVLNATSNTDEAMGGLGQAGRWALAILGLPSTLTVLSFLFQMRHQGSLGTAQSVLRKAASKRESVGESYRGFMSEVKDELEILFEVINSYNRKVKKDGETLALAVIVDDLDRCPKEKIMEMLKATHLLLEQPRAPMAVFLAVDPQLVTSAITASLEGLPNTVKALQYLDKIIHIPFCLPRISEESRLALLDSLLNGNDNSCPRTLGRLKQLPQILTSASSVWKTSAARLVPSESQRRKFKDDHPELSLLDGTPCAVELMLRLECLKTTCGFSLNTAPLAEAVASFYAELARMYGGKAPPTRAKTDKSQECVKLLEKLNLAVNECLGRETVILARSVSLGVAEEKGGEEKNETNQVAEEKHGTEKGAGENVVKDNQAAAPAGAGSTAAAPLPERAITLDSAISVDENMMFIAMFKIAKASPRKMKRVVNVYFLQRSIALESPWMPELSREFVTWTILAEFWPFRLTCLVYAMTKDARDSPVAHKEDASISLVYKGSSAEAPRTPRGSATLATGVAYAGVGEWIHRNRKKKGVKDLYFSDEPEEDFVAAMDVGAQITKAQVRQCFLPHSFNLNPALMSAVKMEMSNFCAAGSTVGSSNDSDHAQATPTEVASMEESDSADSDDTDERSWADEEGL
ncbi:unnamed protein product [Scytosiphon promiscuus]